MNVFVMDQANLLKNSDSSTVINERKSAPKTSFSNHIEKKIAEERRQNLFSSQERRAQQIAAQKKLAEEQKDQAARSKKNKEASIAARLEEFLNRLKELANDEKDGPGQWAFAVPDSQILQQVGKDAGMSATEIANLIEQSKEQGGKLGVVEFFEALSRNLNAQEKLQLVSVPETDLPLLETFLARMGVAVEDIKNLSNNSITGDGRLDMTQFLKGLEQIKGAGTTTLSEWEGEQLRDILARAGASESLQSSLLWEKGGRWAAPQGQDAPVVLGIGRFKNMISQAINEINANRLHPDVPAFLADLENILSQAGFEDKTVGWSPAVQNSIGSAYNELLKSVDLSTARAQMGDGPLPWDFALAAGLDSTDLTTGPLGQIDSKFSLQRIAAAMQQQVIEQISRSILHGLQRNDHHLVLNLHPPELGEVKIDLAVRHDQVTVSFNMENSHVKELLESNMQQFQDNLAERGFTLGACNVSVGQQDPRKDASDFIFDRRNPDLVPDQLVTQITDDIFSSANLYDRHDGRINLLV